MRRINERSTKTISHKRVSFRKTVYNMSNTGAIKVLTRMVPVDFFLLHSIYQPKSIRITMINSRGFLQLCLSASCEPFSLFHHSVLTWLDCFTVMVHCISFEASMRVKNVCVLITTESKAKIWYQ